MSTRRTPVGPGLFIATLVASVLLTPVIHALLLSAISRIALELSVVEEAEELILVSLLAYPVVFVALLSAALWWLARRPMESSQPEPPRRA